MTETTKVHLPLPGVGVVGRGVSIRPRQPYQLKDLLPQLTKSDGQDKRIYSKETDQTYLLPYGYEINDSPPMPSSQALNQTVIEESWERFESNMTLDTSLAAGNAIFSIDATAGQASNLRSNEESYYALRSSFIPLWSVYLHSMNPLTDDELGDLDIKDQTFDHDNRKHYEAFFDRFGTHYVKRVWVGGKATVAFSIAKSSQMTKAEIQAGIQASYGLGAKADAGTSLNESESREKLQSNSEGTVFGKGGDELRLAALSSLDQQRYNEWLVTIKDNPQVIELEVAGIWTLIENKILAKALQDAYIAATTFTPISSVFNIKDDIYFVQGDTYNRYDTKRGATSKPRSMHSKWAPLGEIGFKRADAAFVGYDHFALEEEGLVKKLFLVHKNKYIRIDIGTNEIDEGYPRPLSEGWPGLPFDRLDAAIFDDPKSLYFFNGNHYARYDLATRSFGDEYPELITKRWAGVTFDRIDAAMSWGPEKAYFFRGEQHIRYDMVTYRADPGYPKSIIGSYVEDWKFF
ncbi:MAG: hemopexin repeat-containing protein [Chloroflexota bacterium]